MNIWKISFQYWMVVFVDDRSSGSLRQPTSDREWVVMDDSRLDDCFMELTERQHNVWVLCRQPLRRVVEYCMKRYIYIKAAGGIVIRPDGSRLLIRRNDHWDMAKGKVEPGETLHDAALREVREETGIPVAVADPLFVKAYHIYNLYGGWHLKQTSWFIMPYDGHDAFLPQGEEGITEAVWVGEEEWRRRLLESYSMLREVATVSSNRG